MEKPGLSAAVTDREGLAQAGGKGRGTERIPLCRAALAPPCAARWGALSHPVRPLGGAVPPAPPAGGRCPTSTARRGALSRPLTPRGSKSAGRARPGALLPHSGIAERPRLSSSAANAGMNKGIWHTLRTKKELIPLAGILSMAAAGAFSFCVYSLFYKSDVIIHKIGSSEPWEAVDPSKPQKLVTVNQKWQPIEELEEVKKLSK